MNRIKKSITYMLCVALAAVALACITLGVNNKAQAAETADDFKVASIGIRLQNDAKETGVRFKINAKADLLNKTDAKVTVYVLPQMFYVDGAHLNAGAVAAQSVELVGEWANEGENGEYKTAYAYIYDFPASNYGVKLLAEACLTYTENGATVTKWTAVSSANSLTDVAKAAKDGGATGTDGYIIETAKITYKNADGTEIKNETLTYGASLNYPAAAVIKNKTQRGWVTSKNTLWNTSWNVQGNMTLTAAYYDGIVVDDRTFSAKGITAEAVNEAAPEGFEKVWKTNDKLSESGGSKYLHGQFYSAEDITRYSEIRYAVKTNYQFSTPSGISPINGWVYYTFIQNNDGTWNMTMTYTQKGEVKTETKNKISLYAGNDYYTAKSLQCLSYNAWYLPYVKAADTSYVYFTELRGVKKPVEITGDKIVDCVYDNIGTDCYGKKVTFTDSSEAVPEGFTVVKEYTCSETSLQGKMTHVDIRGYSEVHFAIKTSGYMQIDTSVDSKTAIKQKYADWLYFTLVNESTEKKVQWRVKVKYQGVEIVNFLNTRDITQPGVCGVLWHGGAAGTMPCDDAAGFKIYTTELRGTLKPVQATLAKAGVSEYSIVVPDKSENIDNYGAATRAAKELKTFFREATGADLGDYVQDTGNLKSDIKYISIGFTNALNNNVEGVDYDALGISGYSIRTIDGNVYISGQGMGLMNGVYEFLRTHFNYEYYTDGFYKIDDCTLKDVVLQTINEEYKPSFEYRLPAYGFEITAAGGYATDPDVGYRMQYNSLSIKGVGENMWHNFFNAIPLEEYKSAHPDWFSPDGSQPCLTRDKDGLATEMAGKVKAVLEASPTATFVMIGQQDNDDWCTCATCKSVISQYGGYNSATYILFMNAVSDKLQPYLVESGRTDVKLGMFAYHKTQDAPVTTVGGKVSLIDGMKLNSNVCVVYAPIEANYYVSFNDEVNASVKKNIEGWGLAADNVLYWIYMENFGYYQLIFDNFGSMQENLQLLHEHNGMWLYNLGQYNNGNSTGFSRYKAYLNAKLMWNVNADVNALTDDFFNNYFGVASADMRKFFNEYRDMTKHIYENEDKTIGYLSINGHTPSASDFWYSSMNKWLGYIDNALAEAEKLSKTDATEGERVTKAVKFESLFIRYALITYFSGNFTSDQLLTMKTEWQADADKLGVTLCGEHKNLETLYKEWGILK